MSPKTAQPWTSHGHVNRALECEAAGDIAGAFDAWQAALAAEPSSLDIVGRLADLAFRLTFFDMAEKFYAHLITRGVQGPAIIAAYASCLREQGRYDEAVDLLKGVLGATPNEAGLWDALGAIMAAKGDNDTALVFFNEALRLDAGHLNARFHRGCALIDAGHIRAGLRDTHICAEAFADTGNRASAELTCAHAALALGELKTGWRWYEGRHKRSTPQEVHYDIPLLRWRNEPLAGARLFVSAEQGLGDEVLFASLLPDLIAEIGADGHVGIGVEPRLVPLFARSFPKAGVVAHQTQTINGRTTRSFAGVDWQRYARWGLMGDYLARLRGDIRAFPARNIFLTPDPQRVAYWREKLAAMSAKPKVGILWKSLKSSALRDRFFSAFDQWRDVLSLDHVDIINLQYGDIDAEMAHAREAGIRIATLDGIDLKQDLDDLAALTCALDVVIGPSNATTNIAGACGANLWLLSPPKAWAQLGQPHYPWYPQAQVFTPPSARDWSPAMVDIRQALLNL